jgi:hypothetical protein
MNEAQVLVLIKGDNRIFALYQGPDAEGKAMVLRLINQESKDASAAVEEAAKNMADRKAKTSPNKGY